MQNYTNKLNELTDTNSKLQIDCEKKTSLLNEISNLLSNVDEEELRKKDIELASLSKEVVSLEKKYASLSSELSNRDNKIKLLDEIPCGDTYPSCKFIKDAFAAKTGYSGIFDQNIEISNDLNLKRTSVLSLEEEVKEQNDRFKSLTQKSFILKDSIAKNELMIEKNRSSIHITENNIQSLKKKLEEYDKNKQKIQNYQDLLSKKDNKNNILANFSRELNTLEKEILELYKNHGSITQKYEIFVKQKEELEKIRKDYAAYDLYLSCMHPNGLSYEIIKSKLPEINQEIAKILSNIVDFSIYLENDDDKLDIMIKHPKYEARPLGFQLEAYLFSRLIALPR